MTAEASSCDHKWRAFESEEMTKLRAEARPTRPPGSWVENAEQCERCGRVEVLISWFGQAHRVAYGPKTEGGPSVINWPTRGQGGSGMQATT